MATIDYSKGIVTAPVSLKGVAELVGATAYDVGKVCTADNINMWAKYKPFPFSSRLGVTTDAERLAVLYGIEIHCFFSLYQSIDAAISQLINNLDNAPWTAVEYVKKQDGNGKTFLYNARYTTVQAPARLSDFMNEDQTKGYKHKTGWGEGEVSDTNGTRITNICFDMYISSSNPLKKKGVVRIETNDSTLSELIVQLSDFTQSATFVRYDANKDKDYEGNFSVDLTSWYVGLVLVASNGKYLVGVSGISASAIYGEAQKNDAISFDMPYDLADGTAKIIPIMSHNFAPTNGKFVTMQNAQISSSSMAVAVAMLGNVYATTTWKNTTGTSSITEDVINRIRNAAIKRTSDGTGTVVSFDFASGDAISFQFIAIVLQSSYSTLDSDCNGNTIADPEDNWVNVTSVEKAYSHMAQYCDNFTNYKPSSNQTTVIASDSASIYNHSIDDPVTCGYAIDLTNALSGFSVDTAYNVNITFTGKLYDQISNNDNYSLVNGNSYFLCLLSTGDSVIIPII